MAKLLPWRLRLTFVYSVLVLFFSTTLGAYAQEGAYQLRTSREISLVATGAAGVTASILLRNKRKPLSVDDIGQLNVSDILAIDRSDHNYSEGAATTSDLLVLSSFATPLVLLAFEDARNDAGTLGLILLETVMLNEAITGITKALVKRPRPYTYNQDVPEAVRTSRENTFSFFSGHTSHTAAVSFFTAKTISDYVDRSGVHVAAWTSAILLPAATGLFRYKAGKHFPSDVVVGYLVGASVGLLVPHLHKSSTEETATGPSNSGVPPRLPELFRVRLVL